MMLSEGSSATSSSAVVASMNSSSTPSSPPRGRRQDEEEPTPPPPPPLTSSERESASSSCTPCKPSEDRWPIRVGVSEGEDSGGKPHECPVLSYDGEALQVEPQDVDGHITITEEDLYQRFMYASVDQAWATIGRVIVNKVNKGKPHQCSKCPKQFKRRYELERHLRTRMHISGGKPLERTMKHPVVEDQLSTTMEQVIIDKGKPHQCSKCPKKFRKRSDLDRHLRTRMHMEVNPSVKNCSVLDQPSVMIEQGQGNLERHLRTRMHMGVKPSNQKWSVKGNQPSVTIGQAIVDKRRRHQCSKCPKKFESPYHLERHLKTRTHSTGVKPSNQKWSVVGYRPSIRIGQGQAILNTRRRHQCPKCPKKFKTRYDLGRHLSTRIHSIGVKPSDKARKQSVGFTETLTLIEGSNTLRQLSRSSDFNQDYKCTECGQRFDAEVALRRHLELHIANLPTSPSPTACTPRVSLRLVRAASLRTPESPAVSPTAPEQYRTANFQTPESPATNLTAPNQHRAANLQTLESPAVSPTAPKQHRAATLRTPESSAVSPTTPKQYECLVCHEWFPRQSQLLVHRRTHRTGEKSFKCAECGRKFSQELSLLDHLWLHIRERPYKGTLSSKSFLQENHLLIHTRLRTGEKPFKCGMCSKSFSLASILRVHMRVHTGEKPYKCGVCSKAFSQTSGLQAHTRVHTGEKPFKCGVCSKAFSQTSGLQAHTRVHTGEKPFKCGVCSKAFSQTSGLQAHTRLHTGERPYKCTSCPMAFAQQSNLRYHVGKTCDAAVRASSVVHPQDVSLSVSAPSQ